MQQPLIFDIKRYSINDGPGIRVTIFFKGCPLSCIWCHNPESISDHKQKLFTAGKCIGCGECVRVCPRHAAELTGDGIVTDPERCDLCGTCAQSCPTLASEISGRPETAANLLSILEKERLLFDQSGGGVTFSGGEPLLHPEFLIPLLDACGERDIHRAIDTCGHIKSSTLLSVAKRTDLFLYDIKLMDSDKHKACTGVGNELILANLQALAAAGAAIQIRIPLISGVNTDPENLAATATFIAGLAGEKKAVNLLPYHAIAAHKYRKLGGAYLADDLQEPDQDDLERAIACFAAHDLKATVGG